VIEHAIAAMSVSAVNLKLSGAWKFQANPFVDFRGAFEVFWEAGDLAAAGISFAPISAHHSYNEKMGTLRGMHYQKAPHGQTKLVSCVHGRVWDVAVDLRPNSPTYLGWEATELSAGSGVALYLPAGCAHGFLTLTDHATVAYLIEGDYQPAAAGTLRWDDPAVGIAWPLREPILSERDRLAPDFQA
jgi:dTDP-4-dehydrorhamnose 3,5-epimerase